MVRLPEFVPVDLQGAILGGCPDGFWSKFNCAYVQTVGSCRASLEDRPVRALLIKDQEMT